MRARRPEGSSPWGPTARSCCPGPASLRPRRHCLPMPMFSPGSVIGSQTQFLTGFNSVPERAGGAGKASAWSSVSARWGREWARGVTRTQSCGPRHVMGIVRSGHRWVPLSGPRRPHGGDGEHVGVPGDSGELAPSRCLEQGLTEEEGPGQHCRLQREVGRGRGDRLPRWPPGSSAGLPPRRQRLRGARPQGPPKAPLGTGVGTLLGHLRPLGHRQV